MVCSNKAVDFGALVERLPKPGEFMGACNPKAKDAQKQRDPGTLANVQMGDAVRPVRLRDGRENRLETEQAPCLVGLRYIYVECPAAGFYVGHPLCFVGGGGPSHIGHAAPSRAYLLQPPLRKRTKGSSDSESSLDFSSFFSCAICPKETKNQCIRGFLI